MRCSHQDVLVEVIDNYEVYRCRKCKKVRIKLRDV